jgi:hypothetical protein
MVGPPRHPREYAATLRPVGELVTYARHRLFTRIVPTIAPAAAAARLAAGQAELGLGVAARSGSAPLPITASRAAYLWDALGQVHDALEFDKAAGGDEVFRQLVLARIIEPTSKADSLRVLEEAGVAAASYPTLNRRLPVFAKAAFRQALSRACAHHAALGPASLQVINMPALVTSLSACRSVTAGVGRRR